MAERRLVVDGRPAQLQARALDVLMALAEQPGRLLSRQALLDRVWAGRVVEDGNLSVHISILRRLLGSDVIVTVPGHGYRLGTDAVAGARSANRSGASLTRGVRLRTNLPAVVPPLIGREVDLRALGAMVDTHRLVTLIGAGGMGKTRLAQALMQTRSDRYEHGVCFVELAALTEPGAVAGAIAAALGVRLGGLGESDAANALAEALEPLSLLLTLDNAEHLLDAVALVASALARRAPNIRLLVTSQAPLRIGGEWLYRLGALAVPDGPCTIGEAMDFGALALFAQRARAIDRHFAITDATLPSVIELCHRLDGVPLAIELAAARAPLLGLARTVAGLDHRLQLLTTGPRDASPRHRTLRAALAWSHALLGPAEQQVFRRLAVFEGSASLAAALAVLSDPPSAAAANASLALDEGNVLDALGSLVDRSLLALAGNADAPRFRLLDSPRALALEALQAAGEDDHWRGRHALAVTALFERAHADLLDGRLGVDDFGAALEADLDNAQAALQWALTWDSGLALTIAPLLSAALGSRRYAQGVALWRAVEPLLDAPSAPLPAAQHAGALLQCAEHWRHTRLRHAHQRALQAQALAFAAGDDRLLFLNLRTLGFTSFRLDDGPALQAAADLARRLDRVEWSPYVRSVRPSTEAWLCMQVGDHDGAIRCCEQQAVMARAAGGGDTAVLVKVVGAQMLAGHIDDCIANARTLAERLAGSRDQQQRCHALSNLSAALLMQGRTAEARQALDDAWSLAGRYGLRPQWADDAALLAALEQRPRAALRLAGYADAMLAALGHPREAMDLQRIEQARALACAALDATDPAPVAEALMAQGARLSDDDVRTLGLARDDL